MTRFFDLIPASLEEPLLGIGLGFFGGWLLILGVVWLARSRPAFAYSTGLVALGVAASLFLSEWYRPLSFSVRARYGVDIGASISLLALTLGLSHRAVRQPGRLFRGLGHLGGFWATFWLASLASQFLVYAAISDWQFGRNRSSFMLTMDATILLAPIVFSCVWFIVARRSADHAMKQRLTSQDNSAFYRDRSIWLPWLLAPLLIMTGPGILFGTAGLSITETAREFVQVLSFLLSGILPAGGMVLGLRKNEYTPGYCGTCGYSLRGLLNPEQITCPECGAVNPA